MKLLTRNPEEVASLSRQKLHNLLDYVGRKLIAGIRARFQKHRLILPLVFRKPAAKNWCVYEKFFHLTSLGSRLGIVVNRMSCATWR